MYRHSQSTKASVVRSSRASQRQERRTQRDEQFGADALHVMQDMGVAQDSMASRPPQSTNAKSKMKKNRSRGHTIRNTLGGEENGKKSMVGVQGGASKDTSSSKTSNASSKKSNGSVKSGKSGKGGRSGNERNRRKNKLNGKVFALSMELIEHVSKGRLEFAEKKIVQGASPDFKDYDKRTPLHLAASEGHLNVVEMLLKRGANPDVKDRWGSKPYDDAVKHGFKEIAETLRAYFAEDQEDTLNKEQHDGLELMEYASRGLETHVREKIAEGTNAGFADYDKRTALHLASCEGYWKIVELLLRNGADASFKDRFGHTAVDDAMMNGRLQVLQIMDNMGVKIPQHIFDKSFTPEFERNMRLIDVCARGNIGKAQKLLMEGADARFADYDLRTPLHLACAEGHGNVVKMLMNAGADASAEDRWNATPFDEAIKNGHQQVMTVLEETVKGDASISPVSVSLASSHRDIPTAFA